jgi:hypothetical protein
MCCSARLASLQAKYIREGANIWRHLSKMVAQHSNPKATSMYQGAENDVLFEAKYNHPAGDATCYVLRLHEQGENMKTIQKL